MFHQHRRLSDYAMPDFEGCWPGAIILKAGFGREELDWTQCSTLVRDFY